jgi:hypothetical protein
MRGRDKFDRQRRHIAELLDRLALTYDPSGPL